LHVAAAVPERGLVLRAGVRVEAVLDLELGREAAAEILVATEAERGVA
jgi:hypothetical protein